MNEEICVEFSGKERSFLSDYFSEIYDDLEMTQQNIVDPHEKIGKDKLCGDRRTFKKLVDGLTDEDRWYSRVEKYKKIAKRIENELED